MRRDNLGGGRQLNRETMLPQGLMVDLPPLSPLSSTGNQCGQTAYPPPACSIVVAPNSTQGVQPGNRCDPPTASQAPVVIVVTPNSTQEVNRCEPPKTCDP